MQSTHISNDECVLPGSSCACLQDEQLLDRIMLSLRLSDGLDLQHLQQSFGPAVVGQLLPAIHKFCDRGLMQLVDAPLVQQTPHQAAAAAAQAGSDVTGTRAAVAVAGAQGLDVVAQLQRRLAAGGSCAVRLTDPAGFLLSNDVIADLFAHLDAK